jgi:hypothetical protein
VGCAVRKSSLPDVKVYYTRDSEAVSMRFSEDMKSLFMTSETDVKIGATEPIPFPIIFNSKLSLMATDTTFPLVVSTLYMDKRTLRGVLSITGMSPSMGVRSHVFECH